MRTIRRLYFYLVSFITFEVVLWGMIGLLRSILSTSEISAGGDALAQALSLTLVGVPIFALHWIWAQRASATDEEEHSSSLRAIFLYAALLATLIPITQNALALIDRTLLSVSDLDPYRAILGGNQTWMDNLIAIALNAIAAAYFIRVLRGDWKTLTDTENFADVRRLHRYIWLLYSLLMVVFGTQQVIRFLFYIPPKILGLVSRDIFVNGLSLLLVGAPIWFFAWKTCQNALLQKDERDSLLRMGVLFLLTLGGVATVLSTAGNVLDIFLRWALGESMTPSEFMSRISGAVSVGVPLGIVWAYYGRWLHHGIDTFGDESRRHGLRRLYYYILALAGLVTAFIGMALLVSFILDVVVDRQLWSADLRSRVSAALATLIVGLPLWLATWPPMQQRALSQGTSGGFARRSMARKTYLYLVLFASVIGGMVSAVTVVFRLLQAALGSEPLDVTGLLDSLQLLALFAIVLTYHLRCLRADGTETARALIERHEKFHVLAFERAGSGFGDAVRTSTQKHAPGLHLTVLASDAEISQEDASARAVILPSDLVVNQPEHLRNFLAAFDGTVIVSPLEHPRILWSAGAKPVEATALTLRQLSEGQEVRQSSGGTSAWMVVVYIFAALFGLQMLIMLFSLGISLIAGGV
ncbi:MAG: hypothetical protein C4583_08915 [Anaerolineaceae bacterium]|nr:MAG: hypothetical protein C4583_08915 [Anaerolineaceae bacterium]